MAIDIVLKEIDKFLASATPEVLCITGKWGVGKTFGWKVRIKEAGSKGRIALRGYSYVSLFGLNSLDDLKFAIFENTVPVTAVDVEPGLESLKANTGAATEALGRKWLWFLQQLPIVKDDIGGLAPVWFLAVKNQIVCIDDLERAGKGLELRDVLGLASNLKEQKKCKVVLVLNDEELRGASDEFRLYFEKVVDARLAFVPTSAESVAIALSNSSPEVKPLRDHCIDLGITNIRVVQKIERLALQLHPILSEFDADVFQGVLKTLTVLAWCTLEPSLAPSLEFLKTKRARQAFGSDKETATPKESEWNALLDEYGFYDVDELDLVLLEGIQNGFF